MILNDKDYWDNRFKTDDWDNSFGREQTLFFYKIAMVNIPKWLKNEINKYNLSICDLGCAEGDGTNLIHQEFPNSNIVGVDFSQSAICRAEESFSNVSFECSDMLAFNKHFDIIFSSNTLEHFSDPKEVLKTILKLSDKYLILLLPFQEINRIDEHFYSFDYDSFPLTIDEHVLVYYKEIDTADCEKTYWIGKQIIVIYANTSNVDIRGFSLEDFDNDNFREKLEIETRYYGLKNKIEYLESKQDALKETLNYKEKEINSLDLQLNDSQDIIDGLNSQLNKVNNELKDANRKLRVRNNHLNQINKQILNMANAKPYRLAYFMHRFKFEFLKGNASSKKNFVKWLSCKVLKKQSKSNKKFNPLLNLAKKNYRYGSTKEMVDLEEYKFLRFKNVKDKLYGFPLSHITCPFKKDMVSIILPVYNGEEMVEKSIESILSQTYTNFELIMINDGSTDRTKEIMDFYKTKDSRIKVYHQENRGLPQTLSTGFKKAQGEFYTWTSDDNIMDANFVEKLVEEMKKDEDIGMVYANIRLIDSNDDFMLDHKWYPNPLGTANVSLPESTLKLNICANNIIGPAFMYRASVAYILEDYSSYLFGIEDYDYWMRLNSLLSIRHSSFNYPIYSYRFHDNSLTSKSEELGIIPMRDRLMIWDDFRRDFYLSPMVWVLNSDETVLKSTLKEKILSKEHILVEEYEIDYLSIPFSVPSVYVHIVSDVKNIKNLVDVPDNFFKVVIVPYLTENMEEYLLDLNYDACITLDTEKDLNLPKLDNFAGWFLINNLDSIFGFLNSKIKNKKLYELEEMVHNDQHTKKVSVIICTHRENETLKRAIESVLNQSFSKNDYEVVLVNNDFRNKNINNLIKEYRKDDLFKNLIREVLAPQKGLSFARNVGMWEAKGEVLIFLDDDSIADKDLVKETWKGFVEHPDAGVIGGNIILNIPEPAPHVLRDGDEALWSQFLIPSDEYMEAKGLHEFPYGANYAVRKEALAAIGGFRTAYGRIGNNFAGGEEILSSIIINKNYEIGLNPKSKVIHDVDKNRFVEEHVEKSITAASFALYMMQMDLYISNYTSYAEVKNQLKQHNKKIKLLNDSDNDLDIFYNQCHIESCKTLLKIMQQDTEKRRKYKALKEESIL